MSVKFDLAIGRRGVSEIIQTFTQVLREYNFINMTRRHFLPHFSRRDLRKKKTR